MRKFVACLLLNCSIYNATAQEVAGFSRTDDNVLYKIIRSGGSLPVCGGCFIEIAFTQQYKDSLLFSTAAAANQMVQMDVATVPPSVYKVFAECKRGDSVVMKVLSDSAFKGGAIPQPFVKGEYFVSGYRIVNIYKEKKQADSAYMVLKARADARMAVQSKVQLVKEDITIRNYLAANNMIAKKTPGGTYVQILQPGKGSKVDNTMIASVNYTGRTLSTDKVFDSNTDPAFQHVEPYEVNMREGNVIPGWLEGLKFFAPGGKGRLLIPSVMAYGKMGSGNDIGPDEILIFDIEIVAAKKIPGVKAATSKPKAGKPVAKKPVKKP